MAEFRQILVTEVDGTIIVRTRKPQLLDVEAICEWAEEIFSLIAPGAKILLDFEGVEFLSSVSINRLILIDQKVKCASGNLKLCSLIPDILEVFVITRLSQLFDISCDQQEALSQC